jgi:hypothetical protein
LDPAFGGVTNYSSGRATYDAVIDTITDSSTSQ